MLSTMCAFLCIFALNTNNVSVQVCKSEFNTLPSCSQLQQHIFISGDDAFGLSATYCPNLLLKSSRRQRTLTNKKELTPPESVNQHNVGQNDLRVVDKVEYKSCQESFKNTYFY